MQYNKIVKDMDIEKYHENKMILSSTGLKELKKSTRHFIQYLTTEQEKKTHFDFGNAFELAIMDKVSGTKLFDKHVSVFRDHELYNKVLSDRPDLKNVRACKEYKDEKESFYSQHEDKYIILDKGEKESLEALNEMVDSCIKDKTIKRLLSNTEYQNSFFWKHPSGVLCKTRPDFNKIKKNVIVDLKTMIDASPEAASRQAAKLEYFLQAVMQCDGAVRSGAMPRVDNYFWLAVEKEPPYNAVIYEYSEYDRDYMTEYYDHLMERAAKSFELIKKLEKNEIDFIMGYGETAENEYGILQMEIPLYYKIRHNINY